MTKMERDQANFQGKNAKADCGNIVLFLFFLIYYKLSAVSLTFFYRVSAGNLPKPTKTQIFRIHTLIQFLVQ